MKERIYTWLRKTIVLPEHSSPREERVSGYTHLAGALFSAAAMVFLLRKWMVEDSSYPLAGLVIFSLSMILLYSSSAAYHLSVKDIPKRVFRVLDHFSVYLLIAGTYTPYSLMSGGAFGFKMITIIWSIALAGMIFKVFMWGKVRIAHSAFYLAMGWVVVFYWKPFTSSMPEGLSPLIIAGGVTYTVGIIFYTVRRIPYHHGIWHLFVMGGSAFYWFGVYSFMV
jgi:hemolysin III